MSVIRLALTDDEPLLTAGLAMILDAQDDMEVVWQATSGAQALRQVQDEQVDLLLLDVQMPGIDGIETTRCLTSQGWGGKVVILTTFDTDGYVLGAIEVAPPVSCSRAPRRRSCWQRSGRCTPGTQSSLQVRRAGCWQRCAVAPVLSTRRRPPPSTATPGR